MRGGNCSENHRETKEHIKLDYEPDETLITNSRWETYNWEYKEWEKIENEVFAKEIWFSQFKNINNQFEYRIIFDWILKTEKIETEKYIKSFGK